tara:strand:- start:108 stop:248 length:141 start_codon:yes stop_codon:yes gene_type:complete
MLIDFITSYVVGFTEGGVKVSFGALFVAAIWFVSTKVRGFAARHRN